MADNKELFSGLDSLIFDQESSINVSDFNKKVEETVTPIETLEDTTDTHTDSTEEDADFINPADFFKTVKEKADAVGNSTDDSNTDDVDDSQEAKPEDALKGWVDYFKGNTLLEEQDLEGFDGSEEALIDSFRKREVRLGLEMVEDYKSQLPAEIKVLADNWEEGVPLNELLNIKSNQIRYSKVSDEKLEESIDTQKAIYAEYLRKTTKYSETKIEKEIQRLTDMDELYEESKEVLGELRKFEAEAEETLKRETKKQREIRMAENAREIKTYEKIVTETKEVIPGLKLDEKLQRDILNKIIHPVGINGYGEPVSYITTVRELDPYKFDMAVTYLASLTSNKEGKPFEDWSKIVKAGETKAVKGLEGILNTAAPKSAKDNIKTAGKQSLIELLAKNQGIFKKNK